MKGRQKRKSSKKVQCDSCGRLFYTKVYESPEGLIYFDCPKCKKRYLVGKISDHGKALRAALILARKDYNELALKIERGLVPRIEGNAGLKALDDKIKHYSDEFKKEYKDLSGTNHEKKS